MSTLPRPSVKLTSAPTEIDLLRWYSLREVLALDARSSAYLATPDVRRNGGCYGTTLANRIRARGERVQEV